MGAGRACGVFSVERHTVTIDLAATERMLCLFLAGGGGGLATKSTTVAVVVAKAMEVEVEVEVNVHRVVAVDLVQAMAVGGHALDHGWRDGRGVAVAVWP